MNERERFLAVFSGDPVDRLPVYYFGTWGETLDRWRAEGLRDDQPIEAQLGLDRDWEAGMWEVQHLAVPWTLTDGQDEVLSEDEHSITVRTSLGAIEQRGKGASTIPHTIEPALKPTRESWARFKRFLDPHDPRRRRPGWEDRAHALAQRDQPNVFLGGSLYGWPRDWMGVEALSLLMYDDPMLLEEIVEHMTSFFIELLKPVLTRTRFEMAYVFEDCCGRAGALFSPATFREHYAKYYRKLTDFYHEAGVPLVLLDSDGDVSALISGWLDAGIDVLFPIEIGTWQADPVELRRRYGKRLGMMGGVDKHLIPQGADVVRRELQRLKPVVDEGGFLPLPDHRIPPSCSLEAFRDYVRVYSEVLGR